MVQSSRIARRVVSVSQRLSLTRQVVRCAVAPVNAAFGDPNPPDISRCEELIERKATYQTTVGRVNHQGALAPQSVDVVERDEVAYR
jgi:hypothetical protein